MTTNKFKAMVHLIVESCHDPERLGATRLNKICWFSDTTAYRMSGVPITPETYVKRPKGPVPKTILRVIRELESDGTLLVREGSHPVYRTRLFYSLKDPDKSLFSDQELGIIEWMTGTICKDHTAASISEISHDQIWAAAADGEEIPLYATLVAEPGEITPEISQWADSMLQRVLANRSSERSKLVAAS
jgi:hypothetical protein